MRKSHAGRNKNQARGIDGKFTSLTVQKNPDETIALTKELYQSKIKRIYDLEKEVETLKVELMKAGHTEQAQALCEAFTRDEIIDMCQAIKNSAFMHNEKGTIQAIRDMDALRELLKLLRALIPSTSRVAIKLDAQQPGSGIDFKVIWYD